jgi:hypothetical protein
LRNVRQFYLTNSEKRYTLCRESFRNEDCKPSLAQGEGRVIENRDEANRRRILKLLQGSGEGEYTELKR